MHWEQGEADRKEEGQGGPTCAIWKQLGHLHGCRPKNRAQYQVLSRPVVEPGGPALASTQGRPPACIHECPQPQGFSQEQSLLTPEWRVSAPCQPMDLFKQANDILTGARGTHPLGTTEPASRSPWLHSVPKCDLHVALCAHSGLLSGAVCVASKPLLSLSGAKDHAFGHLLNVKARPSAHQPGDRRSLKQAPPSTKKALLWFSAQGPVPGSATTPPPTGPSGPEVGATCCCSHPWVTLPLYEPILRAKCPVRIRQQGFKRLSDLSLVKNQSTTRSQGHSTHSLPTGRLLEAQSSVKSYSQVPEVTHIRIQWETECLLDQSPCCEHNPHGALGQGTGPPELATLQPSKAHLPDHTYSQ